jgi:hypothetical protein
MTIADSKESLKLSAEGLELPVFWAGTFMAAADIINANTRPYPSKAG